ncbi:MAG: diguanylate cyclase [Methylococcaceae bacterium]|nr:diguanylate cyclase [Methylococcaceae bacterium]
MKVLIVDDSKTIRALVAECAKTLGHEVFHAETGELALKVVEDNNIDLVLMDVELPGLNGFETTYAIRAMEKIDWFPIIFISSKIDDDSFAKGILSGGDAYLQKPINPLRLQLTITSMERIYMMRQKLHKTQEELVVANKELKLLASFDQLTDLPNRRNFDETLKRQFLLAQRNKNSLAFIMCDIDFFKPYNDHYGHQQGDECLTTIAKAIGSIPDRPTDKACRYGGEEFAVILPDTNRIGGAHVAEKLRQVVLDLAIEHNKSKIGPYVTLSLGLAVYTGQFETKEELIKAADDALYRAKKNGRNRVESF